MRAVSPHDFARLLRRHELRRTLPYFSLPVVLVAVGALVTWSLDWRHIFSIALLGLLTGGLVVEYLVHYLHDLARGRTVDPPAGTIALTPSTITIGAKHRVTRFSVSDVAAARYITSNPFDDLKGLTDVLELSLIAGPTLRIPASFTGFDDLFHALPHVEHVDLG